MVIPILFFSIHQNVSISIYAFVQFLCSSKDAPQIFIDIHIWTVNCKKVALKIQRVWQFSKVHIRTNIEIHFRTRKALQWANTEEDIWTTETTKIHNQIKFPRSSPMQRCNVHTLNYLGTRLFRVQINWCLRIISDIHAERKRLQ